MSRLCRLKTATHGEDGKWAYDEIKSLRAQLAEVTRERDAAYEAVDKNWVSHQQLLATQAHAVRLNELWAEVEQKYLAMLNENGKEAETFKAEGDMYGWNFHKGVESGAIEMHLNITKLIKALSIPINLDALHEDRALECERLATEVLYSDIAQQLRDLAAAHRAKKEVK